MPLNISLRDAVGRTKTQLSLDQRGGTGIIVTDNWGIRRASLQVSEEGQPALLFFDEDGKMIPGGGIVPPKRD